MKRYLIRSGIAPNEIKAPEEMILNNLIGGNIGNLIYAYSIYRNLTTENVEIVPDRYRINENDADYINKNYDAYIIPLADAFRDTFVASLKAYTKLFKKLNIPVIVIGAGVKAPIDKNVEDGFSFDKEVKDFVNAVLERSNIIGLRGQITADYLTSLGFKEGVDHVVIGCPSMYAFGRDLKIKDLNLHENSTVAINSSKLSPEHVLKFITSVTDKYDNYYFIPQWMKEFKMTYLGNQKLGENTDFYPNTINDRYYEEDKVRYPLNAKSWIDFMGEMDFAVGARLHGNITTTIAGTPSLLLTKDARMKELAEYHNLTHIEESELKSGVTLDELVERLDFHAPEKVQARNFDNFIEFLNKNGLDHIYNYEYYNNPPLDKQLEKIKLPNMLAPINKLSPIEISNRLIGYTELAESKENKTNKTNKELRKKVKKQQAIIKKEYKQIDNLTRVLKRKSTRMGISVGTALSTIKEKIKKE